MTVKVTSSSPHVGNGKPKFDPGLEESQLVPLIQSPFIRRQATDSTAGDRISAGMSGPPSRSHVREWIALCLCRFFREFEIDPGIAIRRITQAPGFGIRYDIEMDTAINGAVSKYRIVVEEMPDDRMMISIIKNDQGTTEAIVRHDFNNMGDVVWSKVAVFERRDELEAIMQPTGNGRSRFGAGGMLQRR